MFGDVMKKGFVDGKATALLMMELVQIDSPTGHEKDVAQFVYRKLAAIGAKPHMDKNWNVSVSIPGRGKPIAFSAHLDTVEPGRGIKPRIKNGFVVSDGTTILGADNKSTIASLLQVSRFLLSNRSHRPVEIIFTVGEELDSRGAMRFNYSKIKSKECLCFDAANQPLGTVIIGSPAYDTIDIKVKGRAAHASRPDMGINALDAVATFIREIRMGRWDKFTVFNIGVINGGQVRNTIVGEVTMLGEIRGFKESGIKACKKHIESALKSTAKAHKISYEISFKRETPPYLHNKKSSNGLMEYVGSCMAKEGLKPEFKILWGISDANTFNSKGLTSLNISAGSLENHTVRERISIENMEKINRLILRLAQAI